MEVFLRTLNSSYKPVNFALNRLKNTMRLSSLCHFSELVTTKPQKITRDPILEKTLSPISFEKLASLMAISSESAISAHSKLILDQLSQLNIVSETVTRPSQSLICSGVVKVASPKCHSVASISFCVGGNCVEEVFSSSRNEIVRYCRRDFPITINLARNNEQLWHRVCSYEPTTLCHFYMAPIDDGHIEFLVKYLYLSKEYRGVWHNHKNTIMLKPISQNVFIHQINENEASSLVSVKSKSEARSLFWPQ